MYKQGAKRKPYKMLISAQDDSLVFANESRWHEKPWSVPELASTSEIFDSPTAEYEPTQADTNQADTNQVLNVDQIPILEPLFSDEPYDTSSPKRLCRSDLSNGTDKEANNKTNSRLNDTQKIGNLKPVLDIVGDTQKISFNPQNSGNNDQEIDPIFQQEGNFNETKTAGPNANKNDYTKIKLIESVRINRDDTQIIDHSNEENQVTFPESPFTVAHTSHTQKDTYSEKNFPDFQSQGSFLAPGAKSNSFPCMERKLPNSREYSNSITFTNQLKHSQSVDVLDISNNFPVDQESIDKEMPSERVLDMANEESSLYNPQTYVDTQLVDHKSKKLPTEWQNKSRKILCYGDTQVITNKIQSLDNESQSLDDKIQSLDKKFQSLDLPNTAEKNGIKQVEPVSDSFPDSKEPLSSEKLVFARHQLGDTQVITSVPDVLEFKGIRAPYLTAIETNNKPNESTANIPFLKLKKVEEVVFSSPTKLCESTAVMLHLSSHEILDLLQSAPDTFKNVLNPLNDVSIVDSSLDVIYDHVNKEATTQVVNTQEEVYGESSLELVDLGLGKRISDSPGKGKRSISDLSIASIEGDSLSEVEGPTFVYEDSVFNQKKRKNRSDRTERTSKKEAVIQESNLSLSNYQTEDIECLGTISNTIEATRSGDSESQITSKPNPLSKVPQYIKEGESHTQTEEENINQAWSTSSSELEDISQDPSEQWSKLPFWTTESTNENISQQVKVSSRRNNAIPDDNSQQQLQVLRKEELNSLGIESITNEQAVWAFSLFRNMPAIVCVVGDDSSLVYAPNLKESSIRNSDLHLLDIRVGDFVLRILKFGQYVVTGLSRQSNNSRYTCIRGYDTILIKKRGKHSAGQGAELCFPLLEICMEADQWASHQQRFRIEHEKVNLLLAAYSVVHKILFSNKEHRPSTDLGADLATIIRPPSSKLGVFLGMFFFVTSVEGDRKDKLNQIVTSNGGLLIDDDIDLYLDRSFTSSGTCTLWLKPLKDFKFGALLSDGYSRSAKYLQALALGWPILSEVFVQESVKNPSLVEQWPSFLLPAGLSFCFNGTKSQDVFHFRKNFMNNLSMDGQLSNNAHLMSSIDVLVLKKNQDRKVLNMCGFIFHAFGARSVVSFENCSLLEKHIRANGSDSTLVYDNNESLFQLLFERKSKRKSSKASQKVAVINWEWVAQCVISSLIWKPAVEVQI